MAEQHDSLKHSPSLTQRFDGFLDTVKEKLARIVDEIINGKSISRFEKILSRIIAQKMISHFDENSSYYETLRLLDDIEDDIVLMTDTGVYYTVKDYPHIRFSRRELEEIGNRFTQLHIPELI